MRFPVLSRLRNRLPVQLSVTFGPPPKPPAPKPKKPKRPLSDIERIRAMGDSNAAYEAARLLSETWGYFVSLRSDDWRDAHRTKSRREVVGLFRWGTADGDTALHVIGRGATATDALIDALCQIRPQEGCPRKKA